MALDSTRLKDTIKSNIEAVSNFPGQGQTANFIDDRVLQAICDGIVSEIVGHADVLPASHSGENLSSSTGQIVIIPSTASEGSQSTGATSEDLEVVGMGSVQ